MWVGFYTEEAFQVEGYVTIGSAPDTMNDLLKDGVIDSTVYREMELSDMGYDAMTDGVGPELRLRETEPEEPRSSSIPVLASKLKVSPVEAAQLRDAISKAGMTYLYWGSGLKHLKEWVADDTVGYVTWQVARQWGPLLQEDEPQDGIESQPSFQRDSWKKTLTREARDDEAEVREGVHIRGKGVMPVVGFRHLPFRMTTHEKLDELRVAMMERGGKLRSLFQEEDGDSELRPLTWANTQDFWRNYHEARVQLWTTEFPGLEALIREVYQDRKSLRLESVSHLSHGYRIEWSCADREEKVWPITPKVMRRLYKAVSPLGMVARVVKSGLTWEVTLSE